MESVRPDGSGSAGRSLRHVLAQLRERLDVVRLPLAIGGAAESRQDQTEMVGQLRDYVLPRLTRLDAPLLAVVGGSTGAGKSTLVNTLVGRLVSAPGVLRPTTRSPVVVHHPDDAEWFAGGEILPDLARTADVTSEQTSEQTSEPPADLGARSIRLVADAAVPKGLAILDAPDIDSVVVENRDLASQLLAAADLWLFVTSASRYADAVPWEFLRSAAARSAAVAVVLDRVPADGKQEVSDDLARLLVERGLGEAPMFVVPETTTDEGRLPDDAVADVKEWLTGLAGDAAARAAVVRQTLDGAIRSLVSRTVPLAEAADEQVAAAGQLRAYVGKAYDRAVDTVDEAGRDGSMLRGEVLARWQEFVGTGEIMRSLEAQIGRIRDRVAAAVRGRPQPGHHLTVALEHGLAEVMVDAADHAAEQADTAWRDHPAGRPLLVSGQALASSSPDLPNQAAAAVRAWQGFLLELVAREGQQKRSTARFLSFGVNGLGLVLMIVVFASTGGLTGAEVGVAGGTSVLAQRVLEAVFGDQAVRELATAARTDLRERVREVMDGERGRYDEVLDALGLDEETGTRLRETADAVQVAMARGSGV